MHCSKSSSSVVTLHRKNKEDYGSAIALDVSGAKQDENHAHTKIYTSGT